MDKKRIIKIGIVLLIIAGSIALMSVAGPALFDVLLAMHGL